MNKNYLHSGMQLNFMYQKVGPNRFLLTRNVFWHINGENIFSDVSLIMWILRYVEALIIH